MTTNVYTSKLGLQCPNDCNNQMFVQFMDPMKIGITFGSQTLGGISLAGFYESIEKYITTTVTIRPNEIAKIELGNVGTYGERKDIRRIEMSGHLVDDEEVIVTAGPKGNEHTIYFQSSSDLNIFIENFRNEINKNKCLKSNIEIVDVDTKSSTFKIQTINIGIEMVWFMQIGEDDFVHALQLQTPRRYTNPRCKFLFIMPNYGDLGISSGNIGNSSGTITGTTLPVISNCGIGNSNNGKSAIPGSNQKHLQYAFDDDYTKNSMLATWRTMGKIFVMSSDADIEETDTNLIETIWIKNPQTFAISMQVMIGL